jgi:hypothetical protein
MSVFSTFPNALQPVGFASSRTVPPYSRPPFLALYHFTLASYCPLRHYRQAIVGTPSKAGNSSSVAQPLFFAPNGEGAVRPSKVSRNFDRLDAIFASVRAVFSLPSLKSFRSHTYDSPGAKSPGITTYENDGEGGSAHSFRSSKQQTVKPKRRSPSLLANKRRKSQCLPLHHLVHATHDQRRPLRQLQTAAASISAPTANAAPPPTIPDTLRSATIISTAR